MAQEKIYRIVETLEKTLKTRIPIAAKRSPETLIEELEIYELILDLKKKLHR